MLNDYLSLEIAQHTTLSDAQYLKWNLSWRAEICCSIGKMPKYVFVRVFRKGTKYFKYFKRLIRVSYIWPSAVGRNPLKYSTKVSYKLELEMFYPNIHRTQAAVSIHCRQPVRHPRLWRNGPVSCCTWFAAYGALVALSTRNVGQCPTWWPPCRILVAPSVERRSLADAHY